MISNRGYFSESQRYGTLMTDAFDCRPGRNACVRIPVFSGGDEFFFDDLKMGAPLADNQKAIVSCWLKST
jgi:hypothetical protein